MYRKSRKKFRQKNVEVKLKNETTERLTVKDSQKITDGQNAHK